MAAAKHSLGRTLTTRLLVWQIVVLLALAIGSVFVFYYRDGYTGERFDRDIPETIAKAVSIDGDSLRVAETEDVRALHQNSPDLWYIIEDSDGRRAIGGAVPLRLTSLAEALGDIQTLHIISTAPDFGGAILLHERSSIGDFAVLFGGGREQAGVAGIWQFARRQVSPYLALLVGLVVVLTTLVVPRVVRTTLSSLHAVERVASRIDIEQRGVRLPNDAVPAEVAALVNAVNAALSRLDEGYAEKQRFLADAAHELRTPIAILLNRLELSRKGEFDSRVFVDVHRLANLAEQLLDLQRIEHEDRPPRQVNMVLLSRNIMADLAPLAVSAGYDPVFETAVDEFIVLGDESSLERGIINLVQNAIIHGGGGGEIVLSVSDDRSISISDSGPGVPEDRREWIFEPFHRLKPRNEGAGLGLSLVREIVRRHKGSISVGRSASGGASFLLRFDRAV